MDWLTAFRDKTLPAAQPNDDLSTGTAVNSIVELPGGGAFDALGDGVAEVQSQTLSKSARVLSAADYDTLRGLIGKRGMLWRSRLVESGVPTGAVFYLPFNADGNRANLTARDGTEPTTETGSVVGVDGGVFGNGAVSLVQSGKNYIYDPFIDSTAAISGINITCTQSADVAHTGNYSEKVHLNTGDTGASGTIAEGYGLLADGGSVTLSAMVYIPAGSTAQTVRLRVKGSTTGISTWTNTITDTGEWKKVSCTYTNTSGSTDNIVAYVYITGTAGADCYYYVDDMRLTETDYVLPARNGDMNGCSWDGTAYASTTTVTASKLAYADQLDGTAGTLGIIWTPADDSTAQKTAYLFDNGTLSAYFNSTDSKLYLTDNTNTISGAVTFSADDDIYAYFAWGSAGLAIYVDGALLTSGATYTAGASGTLYIGGDTAGASIVNGELCESAITDYAMDATEIAAIYNAGVALSAARIQRGIDARCMGMSAKRQTENANHIDATLDFATIGKAWRGEVRQIANDILSASGTLTLTNSGDVTCKNLVVTISATGASTITLATNGFSMTASTTTASDELVIDCAAHTVTLNGSDNYSSVTFGANTTADWLPLAVGDNTLTVTLSGAEIEIIAQWYDTYR